jgi:hypothetical protein
MMNIVPKRRLEKKKNISKRRVEKKKNVRHQRGTEKMKNICTI